MTPTIVHAAGFFPEYGGNFIASLAHLRDSCRELGWDMVAVFPEAARQTPWCAELVAQDWRIHFLPQDASRARCSWTLARIICEEGALAIHAHFVQYDLPAWWAARLASRGGKKVQVVWHVHSELNAPLTLVRRITNLIKYRLMGRSAWMIAVGESVALGVLAAGCPAGRIRTVENGVDLARAMATTETRSQVLASMGIEVSDRLILMFGFEPFRKGVDIALDAVAELVKERDRVVLGIVGRNDLRAFVQERVGVQLPSWLRVTGPTENVANLYHATTIFLSASRSEGLPYSVCEAMANRLPVILSDIPSVSWAHRSKGTLFFPSGDSAALAAAIREVLGWNIEQQELHVIANEDLIKTEFAVSVWVDRILRLYVEILGQNKRASINSTATLT